MNRPHRVKNRNCRNLQVPSRVRRQVMAENFDRQWGELRRHVTIERETPKLEKLIADWRNTNR
jgi:hypothetical protein